MTGGMCVQEPVAPRRVILGGCTQPITPRELRTECQAALVTVVSPGHLRIPSPQVGAIGDEEEWVTLYEEENEPDAQMLEIPNLTPYTHYR